MKVLKNIIEIRKTCKQIKLKNQTIGLVPTMGFLHKGHLSLAKKSVQENDCTVMSIFVNPTQFSPNEDFDQYPRNLERDVQLAEKAGVDLIFFPDSKEIYPQNFCTFVEVDKLTQTLEGESRPTHFRGVTTVVSKLFNIIPADNAYFGQKDLQQASIISKMSKDLNFDINIKILPICRDENGLALSSRNIFLSASEYKTALELNKTLKFIVNQCTNNNTLSSRYLINIAINKIEKFKDIKLDYISIKNFSDFKTPEFIDNDSYILIAAKIGKVRLIDNMKLT